MKNLAIIPARGGSKRIPGKNIREFLGKPIIAYSIESAVKSGLFDEVMVSTDSDEIADIALKYGAKIPFLRSADNAGDFASLADVIDEVSNSYRQINRSFVYACCILPTAPLVSTEKLAEGLQIITQKNCDTVFPVVRFGYPIQRALKITDGKVQMFNPEHRYSRSQDLETAFHDAGMFYWFNFEKGLRGDNKHAVILNETEVQDIDSDEDWRIAEMKYKLNDLRMKNE